MSQSRSEKLIEKIYQLAKSKDIDSLKALINDGVCINVRFKNETAIYKLAKENEVEIINILEKEFAISLNSAVVGAANGGHEVLVENLIGRGASLDSAAQGAAIGGHETLVENLIERGASLDCAVYRAAVGGHEGLVENLLVRGASSESVVAGYRDHLLQLALTDQLLPFLSLFKSKQLVHDLVDYTPCRDHCH
jgi:hypothetical protein